MCSQVSIQAASDRGLMLNLLMFWLLEYILPTSLICTLRGLKGRSVGKDEGPTRIRKVGLHGGGAFDLDLEDWELIFVQRGEKRTSQAKTKCIYDDKEMIGQEAN